MNSKSISFGSICTKEIKPELTTDPHILPIYATSSFAFKDIDQGIDIFTKKQKGHVYGRYGNPTIDVVNKKIALLEGYDLVEKPEALMTSSGMAAIQTLIISLLKSGDTILSQSNIYGGTTELFNSVLNDLGIKTIYTDLSKIQNVDNVLSSNKVSLIYFETPSNPGMDCVDILAICDLAKKYNAKTMVDNTFATPYLQRPFNYGVDYIIHSTTKYLNGHGNSIAGVIVGRDKEFMLNEVWKKLKLTGSTCNPFDAWLVHNGLKTLTLRMDKHSQNALTLAEFLATHPKVSKVNYNGLPSHPHHEIAKKQMSQFGGMLSFELAGGLDSGVTFMKNISFCTLAPTLGDVDTLILHPASMSHVNIPKHIREENGITDGLVRVSVGIEGVVDIINDLTSALEFI